MPILADCPPKILIPSRWAAESRPSLDAPVDLLVLMVVESFKVYKVYAIRNT